MDSSEQDKNMAETDNVNHLTSDIKVAEAERDKQTSSDSQIAEVKGEKQMSIDTNISEVDGEKQMPIDTNITEVDSVSLSQTTNGTKMTEAEGEQKSPIDTKIAEADVEKQEPTDTNISKADDDKQTSSSSRRQSFFHNLMGPKLFTLHATLIIALRTTCYGYFSGILTTLERRFQLSSSEAGTLIIINDISELCFIVIASHFGHKSHRPRWIAIGSVTMGIGMLICAIPHFSMPALDPDAVQLGIYRGVSYGDEGSDFDTSGLCKQPLLRNDVDGDEEGTETTYFNTTAECQQSSSSAGSVAWIVIGQIIVGIGSAPMFPLIMSYIDDSVSRRKYTSYTAVIFMAFAIGPPLGLLMGAWASAFYVDFNRIASDKVPDIPLEDPRWIGAWWLGLIVCFIGLVLVGIPMYFYPRSMVAWMQRKDEKVDGKGDISEKGGEEKRRRSRQRSRGNSMIFEQTTHLKGLIKSVKRLIMNVPLTMFCLGASCELAAIGMFGSFGIKYMQTQFGLSVTSASNIFGAILVPVSIFSNIASAYVCRRYKLNVKQCAWFLLILVCLTLPFIPIVMAVGCQNMPVAGVNTNYAEASEMNDQIRNEELVSSCNTDCRCNIETFQPVCGADSVTYISPCLAGCTVMDNQTGFSDCQCISQSYNSTATPGQCESECPGSSLIVFVLMVFLILFFLASIQNPGAYIIIRVVRERDRSVAVGWKILVTKILGYFPSPIYVGAIINSTCILWQYSCGDRGSCWLYDIASYRLAFFGTVLALRLLSIICYSIMIWFLRDDYKDDIVKRKKSEPEINEVKEVGTNIDNCDTKL